MSKNLNDNYKDIIEFLYAGSYTYCIELGIELDIQILDEDISILNAGVHHVKDNLYQINIFPRCLNLFYEIENITKKYTADDLQFFFRAKHLGIFKRFEEDTYREDLNNLFATMILLQIFFHECGHIQAKHVCESVNMYEEYDSTRNGSYELQEHELVADWLSTKFVFRSTFYAVVKNDIFDNEEVIRILEQITVLYWLALTIEFQIFDSNHMRLIDDFSTLTHPHPVVRLYYNLDAMSECMADILTTYGLNDDQAEAGVANIIDETYIYIQSFLQITDTPIDYKKNDYKIMECYIKLRDIPYEEGIKKDNYFHLIPLPDEYREQYEEYRDAHKN